MEARDHDREHYTVDGAAERLGLTPGRIRQMLRDGHLDGTPPGEPGSGRTGWRVDPRSVEERAATQSQRGRDESRRHDPGSELVAELRDRVRSLERQLDQERDARTEERRRHDMLMAQLMQRIPELTAAPEPRESDLSAGETAGKGDVPPEPQPSTQRKSWWRRVVGG